MRKGIFKRLFIFLLLTGLAFSTKIAIAQISISGHVISEIDATPLGGVNVQIKGKSRGTTTDDNGAFHINAEMGNVLIFSRVGYVEKEFKIKDTKDVFITLSALSHSMNEVVVTALGIKKEKRALGYSTQEMKGDELTVARETNLVNQLAGKIAGVTVMSSPSGIGGSARVSIRGERSVDLNKNQPLYVIDGIPISNSITGGSGKGNMEVDFGNGASFINPDDVESINILKGPAAAALYGSRAANGVIIIKTKSGKVSKGLGVEYNGNITFETPLKLPKYQSKYGQGNGNGGDFAFVDGKGGGKTDGTDEAWGPEFKGQLYPQYNSPRTLNGQAIPYMGGDMNAPAGSIITPTLWVAEKDNLKKFLQTGRTLTNTISLSGANDHGDFRLGYTNLNQIGIVPNTDLKRNTISLSAGYKFTQKFSAKGYVSYIKSASDNRPSISYGTESIMYLFNCWLPPSVSLGDMKRLWMKDQDNLRQFGWNYNYHDNPYLTVYQNTNGQYYNRIIGNISLKYDFTNWLSLQLRTATDWSSERREYRRAFSTQRFPYGEYREVNITNEERNTDFLLTANRNLNDLWSISANLGGNQMKQSARLNEDAVGQLTIPNIYTTTNNRIPVVPEQYYIPKKVNSAYGALGFGYNNKIFVDFTGRNDWSSALTLPQSLKTLGKQTNSYFYGSAALSVILSELVKMPTFISYSKLRSSYAQVGNDTDPFTYTQSITPGTPFGSIPVYGEGSRLVNFNLKPEISSSVELGAEFKFLNNRIGLDITYYNTITKNQIINIPLTISTGYDTRSINAGKIKNYGWEAMLNIVPIKNKIIQWNVDLNFSANRSKVLELSDSLKNFVMASRSVSVEARVGERMGDMYGIGFARVQNTDPNGKYYDATGKYVGQMVFENGRPVATSNRIKLGNYNPDYLIGIRNSFKIYGVNLSFLFDMRQGGKLYSHTQTVGREGGIITETLEGRADGYDLTKEGNGVIGEGVKFLNGKILKNDVKLTAREWHSAWTDRRSIAEGVMYDASFVKLRELILGYTIPNKIFKSVPIRDVNVSFVGRNLFVWDKVPHVDPENMSYSGGTALPGIEYMSIPTTKSYGINISLKF